jgi:UDP-3-O-[3-hydroxymyristoyl] glucosamine N-acyltransferase
MNEHLSELLKAGVVAKRKHRDKIIYRSIGPNSVYIGPDVEIGEGTILWPNVYLLGKTKIGDHCEVEPGVMLENVVVGKSTTIHANCNIRDSSIGKNCVIWVLTSMYKAIIEDNVTIHRSQRIVWSRIGRGSKLEQDCMIKYAEIGADCTLCHSIIEGEHLPEEALYAGKKTLRIGPGCKIGPFVYLRGSRFIPPYSQIIGMHTNPDQQ